MDILKFIQNLSEGYSEAIYNQKKYSITKQTFNNGKSYKIYGKELQGTDFISLNYTLLLKKSF
ncbi:peptide methionine sulfoxide reductase [uncultured Polaribacter sp.]|uniref:peptide methionine sulfoxide reductase n=1 Tax=uncultured Polaribacter sp. TaxID=174711 RepID=UPI00345920D7